MNRPRLLHSCSKCLAFLFTILSLPSNGLSRCLLWFICVINVCIPIWFICLSLMYVFPCDLSVFHNVCSIWKGNHIDGKQDNVKIWESEFLFWLNPYIWCPFLFRINMTCTFFCQQNNSSLWLFSTFDMRMFNRRNTEFPVIIFVSPSPISDTQRIYELLMRQQPSYEVLFRPWI